MTPTLNDPDGLVNLRNLSQEVERIAPADKSIPIVFVPGFSGWGVPLLGAVNYFGGIIDIPTLLADRGHTVIVAPVAPISTNWERACELYRQLTFGQFSKVNQNTGVIDEDYDVDIDYGTYFTSSPHRPDDITPDGRVTTTCRRRAFLVSKSSNFRKWSWGRHHKVHFVCHSQGGNTVRFLIGLMANGARGWHPEYFSEAGRDDWTISVTTLGTPHRGTTVVDVLESFLSRSRQQATGLVARFFAASSFYPPTRRTYDLQLDHWGIRRNAGETFQQMLARMEAQNGPVWKWLNSDNNALYDNSIKGVQKLTHRVPSQSDKIFYFSLSFHATDPFPEAWPAWSKDASQSFPIGLVNLWRTAVAFLPILGVVGGAVEPILNTSAGIGWDIFTATLPFRPFGEWATQAVITRFLRDWGYDLVLPNPGRYVPRKDAIPIFLPTIYAMGSHELSQAQRDILGSNLGDWLQNDGIVNTESMSGPDGAVSAVSSLPDFDFRIAGKRGIYWHLGANNKMDHADEIGVFIEQNTANLTQEMYLNIANLISRLPTS